jgi:hypothetical protein
MKLQLEFDAKTAFGVLEALEVYTNSFRAPETFDSTAALEYLTILRNAIRPYSPEIRLDLKRIDTDRQGLFP